MKKIRRWIKVDKRQLLLTLFSGMNLAFATAMVIQAQYGLAILNSITGFVILAVVFKLSEEGQENVRSECDSENKL